MIVRALEAGDWTFGRGKSDYKRGLYAVAQNIQTRLSSFLGDCFFATADGIDWDNLIGSKNQLALNLAVSAAILNTQHVTSIVQLSVRLNAARNLEIQYRVQTSYSRTVEGSYVNELVG